MKERSIHVLLFPHMVMTDFFTDRGVWNDTKRYNTIRYDIRHVIVRYDPIPVLIPRDREVVVGTVPNSAVDVGQTHVISPSFDPT